MTVEAAVAVGSGVATTGLLLMARGEVFAERTQRAEARIGAVLLFALANYIE